MKKYVTRFALIIIAALSFACSSDMGDFQQNQADPEFVLFDMFENEPALDEIWDIMDQNEMNSIMADMINTNKEDFITFSHIGREILEEGTILPPMLRDVRTMLALILSSDVRFRESTALQSFYSRTPEEYRSVIYALSDRLRSDTTDPGMTDSILSIARTVTNYLLTEKTPADLQSTMTDLVADINDLERDDFILLTKNLGKMMAAASTPMLIKYPEFSSSVNNGLFGTLVTENSSTTGTTVNSGLGNVVKGNHALITGLRDRLDGEITDRSLVYDLIADIRETVLNKDNSPVVKDFVYNVEDYFTKGGSIYGAAVNTTNTDVTANFYNTSSTNLYSDTEISNTLKEVLAASIGLLLRDDRCGALTPAEGSKSYALERFTQRLVDTGIDWKNAKVEESIYDMLVIDPYGRDRSQTTGFDGKKPYAISFLEDFFFLAGVTNNFGWKDGGTAKNEIASGGTDGYRDVCNSHGHGEPTNYITMNDSLFSMTGTTTLGNGTYELALDGNDTDAIRYNKIFRSYRPFTRGQVIADPGKYNFFYDQNYGALCFLTGASVGDAGLPGSGYNGGNISGNGGSTLNSYRAYCGNGIGERELAGWTLGWVSRACFEGEGPYYYKDPNAESQTIDGTTYYKYMRPNGKIYAWVSFDADGKPNKYLYALDGNDPEDVYQDLDLVNTSAYPSSVKKRDNRYKSKWRTEYFMIKPEGYARYYGFDGQIVNNTDQAGSLIYNELIGELDTARMCASQEEAIFRNYQWIMTEKKFIIIIPLCLYGAAGLANSNVFQIIEGHGIAGMCPARKFRANKTWAKANTTGASNIPGDYRLDVRVNQVFGIVDEATVYDNTLGFGPSNYSVVFHALAPLYRFGFPRSPLLSHADYGVSSNFKHYQLGSKQFTVNDTNWNKRNMVMPLLMSLISVLHESSTPDNRAVSNFGDGLTPLLKPLFFYNKDIAGNGLCTDSILPRVTGGAADHAYLYPFANSLIPEQFITGFLDIDSTDTDGAAWFGGWAVRNYFMAKPMTTLFSTLVDRNPIDTANPDSNRTGRGKGILPLLTQYDMSQPRSDTNQSPTRIVSNLLDQLTILSDTKYDDKAGIDYGASDFDNSQYTNWGVRRRILYGLEQIMSAGKMSKAPYIQILQNLSKSGASATKAQRIPEWIFQQRDVDVDMNELLEKIVGFNDPDGTGPLEAEGLAGYPDDKPAYADWTEYDEDLDDLANLIDKLVVRDAPYNITDNLLDAVNLFLAKNFTDDEISSVMFETGKLFASYNGTRWVWHGEESVDTPDNPATDFAFLWRMIKNYLPLVHQQVAPDNTDPAGGENYMAMMRVLSTTLKEGGLLEFMLDLPNLSANSEDLFNAVYNFLGENFVTGSGTPGAGAMWVTIADLLDDLAENVGNTTPETVSQIYSDYGFQQNQ